MGNTSVPGNEGSFPNSASNFQVTQNSPPDDPARFGLLEIEVDLSNPEPTAGNSFTVYVLVTNPFDRPIWVDVPRIFLPSELMALKKEKDWSNIGRVEELLYKAKSEKINVAFRNSFKEFIKEDFKSVLTREARFEGILKKLARRAIKISDRINSIEVSLIGVRKKIQDKTANMDFSAIKKIQENDNTFKELKTEEAEHLEYLTACKEHFSLITQQIGSLTGCLIVTSDENLLVTGLQLQKNQGLYIHAEGNLEIEEPTIVNSEVLDGSIPNAHCLPSGNKAVYSLMLQTKRELFFRPIEYGIRYSVNFSFKPSDHDGTKIGTKCTNTISQKLVIRAPLSSVMIGAGSGGFVGTFTRILQQNLDAGLPNISSNLIFPVIISVTLSAIAVVFLARKADTQSIVSIEDFWGGLVIGFLVGYTGISFFESIAGITD